MKKSEPQFAHDEYILAELPQVTQDGTFPAKIGKLTLTNKRMLFFKIAGFGNPKLSSEWPVSAVKAANGEAQVKVSNRFGTKTQIDIHLGVGLLSFLALGLNNADVIKFANQLNHAVTNTDEDIYDETTQQSGASVRSVFKSALGHSATEAKRVNRSAQRVSMTCLNCGAQVEGIRDKVAKCPYCDSKFNL